MPLRAENAPGESFDEETGLDYFGARYYAPWLGRWTTADPLGLQAGLNLYLYGRASPVVFNDPTGLDAKPGQVVTRPDGSSYTVGGGDDPFANMVVPTEGPDEVAPGGGGYGTGSGTGVGAGSGSGTPVGSPGGAPGGRAQPDDIVPFDPYADDPFDAWLIENAPSDSTLETAQDVLFYGSLTLLAAATGGAAVGAAAGLGLGSFTVGAISGALSGSFFLGGSSLYEGRDPTAEEAAVAIGGSALTGGIAGKLGQWAGRLGRRDYRIDDTASPQTPVGRQGKKATFPSPQEFGGVNPPPRNAPGRVFGRDYSGHAFDRMQERGFTPSVVENTIKHGKRLVQPDRGTILFEDKANGIKVSIDAKTGRVVTIW